MKAVQLTGLQGLDSLKLVEIEIPKPKSNEILIQVKAAGINFAELEMTLGRYPAPRPLPCVLGFEAAGVVVGVGEAVKNFEIGDRVTSIVSSGGYAEYAVADAGYAIPIPDGISFAQASTITIQGLSAYTMLTLAARPQPHERVLVQSAAGGMGLFLVQLLKILGVQHVIALASSAEKLELVKQLGADHAINYSDPNWASQVRTVTQGRGVDLVLEAASGSVGDESFRLLAPFGRSVFYGARNVYDMLSPDKMRQLIHHNQQVIGFNFPSLRPEQIAEAVPKLMELIVSRRLLLYAEQSYSLDEVRNAFQAITNRRTVGKVVLVPEAA